MSFGSVTVGYGCASFVRRTHMLMHEIGQLWLKYAVKGLEIGLKKAVKKRALSEPNHVSGS